MMIILMKIIWLLIFHLLLGPTQIDCGVGDEGARSAERVDWPAEGGNHDDDEDIHDDNNDDNHDDVMDDDGDCNYNYNDDSDD